MISTYKIVVSDPTLALIETVAQQIYSYNTSDNELLSLSRDLLTTTYRYYSTSLFIEPENTTGTSVLSITNQKYLLSNLTSGEITLNNVTISVSSLPVANTSVINLMITRYVGYSNYSDGIEINFALTDDYDEYNFVSGNYTPLTTFTSPIILTMPAYQYVDNYICAYLDSNNTFSIDGCQVLNITYNNATNTTLVTFEISHASLFTFLPGILGICGYDYAPFIILIIVFFIELFIMPCVLLSDNSQKYATQESSSSDQGLSKTIDNSPSNGSSPVSPTERPLTSLSYSIPEVEEFSNSSVENPEIADYTIEFVLKPFDSLEKKIAISPKSIWQNMLEGHLLFGLFIYRPIFSRFRRVLTLFSIIMLQLLLEGLLIKGVENYNKGTNMSTQHIFDNYIGDYFGYTVLAIAIAFPVEVFLIVAFSKDKEKHPVLFYFAIALAVLIIIGSFIGVFILTFKFCFEWAGYWAASFLWSVLIEIFFLQFMFMIVRYYIFRDKSSILARN